MKTYNFIIDARIDLCEICEDSKWHRATAIDAMIAQGLLLADAEAFASFRFADKAECADVDDPADHLSTSQYERLGSDA